MLIITSSIATVLSIFIIIIKEVYFGNLVHESLKKDGQKEKARNNKKKDLFLLFMLD